MGRDEVPAYTLAARAQPCLRRSRNTRREGDMDYDKFEDVCACFYTNGVAKDLYEKAEAMSNEKGSTIKEAYTMQLRARILAVQDSSASKKYLKIAAESLYLYFQSEFPEIADQLRTYETFVSYFMTKIIGKIKIDITLNDKHRILLSFSRHMISSVSNFVLQDTNLVLDCPTRNKYMASIKIIKDQCFNNITAFKQYVFESFTGKKPKPLDSGGYISGKGAPDKDTTHRNTVLTRQVTQLEEQKDKLLLHIVKMREELKTIKEENVSLRTALSISQGQPILGTAQATPIAPMSTAAAQMATQMRPVATPQSPPRQTSYSQSDVISNTTSTQGGGSRYSNDRGTSSSIISSGGGGDDEEEESMTEFTDDDLI